MPSLDGLKEQALVVERLSMARFRVELAGGRRLSATVSGRLRLRFTRIAPGHRVLVSVSPYDLTQGTIIQRLHESQPDTDNLQKR
jgi:translation initiation factor IF-1